MTNKSMFVMVVFGNYYDTQRADPQPVHNDKLRWRQRSECDYNYTVKNSFLR